MQKQILSVGDLLDARGRLNLASRLEGKAPVDGVLVSASVYEAVKASVATRFSGRITAKGIVE